MNKNQLNFLCFLVLLDEVFCWLISLKVLNTLTFLLLLTDKKHLNILIAYFFCVTVKVSL